MVDSVTNKYEFLAVPREKKKKDFFFFLELIIPFLLDRTEILFKSNQLSKYIMVTEVYPSHIGLRTSWHNRRGEVWT